MSSRRACSRVRNYGVWPPEELFTELPEQGPGKAGKVRYHTDRDQDPPTTTTPPRWCPTHTAARAHQGFCLLPPTGTTRATTGSRRSGSSARPRPTMTNLTMTTWSAMIGQPRIRGAYANFHGSSDGVDLRGRGDVPPAHNRSVPGQVFRPDPAIAQAARHQHVSARFGRRVSPPGRR